MTGANVTPSAGIGFILRGGDTWHFGNSGASPYTGGTWNWSWNGSSGSPIYIGVDLAWYSGGSWSRPVMNGDNPLSTSAVASCAYQTSGGNVFLSEAVTHYVTWDNFEWTGKCEKTSGFGINEYIYDASSTYTNFEHMYFHGTTHIPYNCSGGGMCFSNSASAFVGGTGSGVPVGTQYLYDVFDGSDSDPTAQGAAYDGFFTVAYCVFNNLAQLVTTYTHLFHDNLMMNWVDPQGGIAHGNVLEIVGEPATVNAYYNNVFLHLYDTGVQGVCFWPHPQTGIPDYVFNNVWADASCGGNFINIGQNAVQPVNQGPLYVFNNTMESPINGYIITEAPTNPYTHVSYLTNNHYITDASSPYLGVTQATFTTELLMTHATATRDGYSPLETYVYSPVSSGVPTSGTGTNE